MSRPPLPIVAATGALAAVLFAATIAAEFADASAPMTTVATTATTAAAARGSTIAAASPTALAALERRGLILVQVKGCVGCHTIRGLSTMRVGPDLDALPAVAGARRPGVSAEAYVRESIREPGAFVVPGYTGVAMPQLGLTDAEIDAVAAFLLTPR